MIEEHKEKKTKVNLFEKFPDIDPKNELHQAMTNEIKGNKDWASLSD